MTFFLPCWVKKSICEASEGVKLVDGPRAQTSSGVGRYKASERALRSLLHGKAMSYSENEEC